MKIWRFFLFCLYFTSVGQNLWADMIPAGQRRVDAYFRLATIDQYPDYVFLAYSQDRFGDTYSILDKKGISLNKQSRTSVFAIPKADFNEADIQADTAQSSNGATQRYGHYFTENPKLIRTGTEIYPHDFIAESDSAVRVEDVWTIKTLTPDTLIIASDSEVYTYASGRVDIRRESATNQLGWLVPGALAIAVLLVVLYVRNRKR